MWLLDRLMARFDKRDEDHDHSSTIHPQPPPRRRKFHSVEGSVFNQDQRSECITELPSSISEHQMVCTRSPKTGSDSIMKRHKYASSQPLHIGEIPSDPQRPIKGDNFCDSLFGEYLPQSVAKSESVISTDGHMAHNGNLSYSSSFPDPNIESMDKLDIIGESSETRFPWQRDVSTQCDMPLFSHRSSISSRSSRTSFDSDDSQDGAFLPSPPKADVLKRQRMFRHSRPHSVGCLENTIYEEEVQQMREQSRRARKSDSFLHSTFPYNRKRLPYFAPEDSGSVSDLESITEYPSREGCTISAFQKKRASA